MKHIGIRHMRKEDLGPAVEIERLENLITFDVPVVGECQGLSPWAWTRDNYLTAIRQYRSKTKGTYDTRAYVAIATHVEVELVAGSLVYEIREDGFEILRMSAVQGDNDARQMFVDHLLRLCEMSRKRNTLWCYISDSDWASLRFFVRLGWERRLLPSYFRDGRDGWLVQTTVVPAPPPRREAAGA